MTTESPEKHEPDIEFGTPTSKKGSSSTRTAKSLKATGLLLATSAIVLLGTHYLDTSHTPVPGPQTPATQKQESHLQALAPKPTEAPHAPISTTKTQPASESSKPDKASEKKETETDKSRPSPQKPETENTTTSKQDTTPAPTTPPQKSQTDQTPKPDAVTQTALPAPPVTKPPEIIATSHDAIAPAHDDGKAEAQAKPNETKDSPIKAVLPFSTDEDKKTKHTETKTNPDSDPMSPKLVDNHWILQSADPGIALYRIRPSTNQDDPITYSITKYRSWNVACESRGDKTSCFSNAHQTANKATITIRIGVASRLATPNAPDYNLTETPIESGSDYRYILEIVLPPHLPPQTRVTLATNSAIGSSPTSKRCDEAGCHISFYVSSNPNILTSGEDDSDEMTVTVNINTSAYAWIFPTQGLASAMRRTVGEMNLLAAKSQTTPSGSHLPRQ